MAVDTLAMRRMIRKPLMASSLPANIHFSVNHSGARCQQFTEGHPYIISTIPGPETMALET